MVRVGGYQQYNASVVDKILTVKPHSYAKKTRAMLAVFEEAKTLNIRSVADVGACTGLMGLLARTTLSNISKVVHYEHDNNYIDVTRKVYAFLEEQGSRTCSLDIVQGTITPKTPAPSADMVLGLAIMHWLYSATAAFGSIDLIVEWFARHRPKMLVLEWISPKDGPASCHIKKNRKVATSAYTHAHFLTAVNRRFADVVPIEYGRPHRVLYKLTRPIFDWKRKNGSTARCWISYSTGRVVKQVHGFLEHGVVDREVFWLKKLNGSGLAPELIAVADSTIIMTYVGEPLSSSNVPKDADAQIRTINSRFLELGLEHNDWRQNAMVLGQKITMIDFQWASLRGDFSCGGRVAPTPDNKKPDNIQEVELLLKLPFVAATK